MALRKLAWVALFSMVSGTVQAAEPSGGGRAAVVKDPDWISRPTGNDLAENYPPLAASLGLEGRAVINCVVDVNGFVSGCKVREETPPGIGFGEAALKLSASFRMSPKTVNGEPVNGAEVSIPITFRLPVKEPGDDARLVSPVRWAERPTAAEMKLAGPRDVKLFAGALVRCTVIREGRELGRLKDCASVTEAPRDSGAGAAALALSPRFRLDPAIARAAPADAKIEMPFEWTQQIITPAPAAAPAP